MFGMIFPTLPGKSVSAPEGECRVAYRSLRVEEMCQVFLLSTNKGVSLNFEQTFSDLFLDFSQLRRTAHEIFGLHKVMADGTE